MKKIIPLSVLFSACLIQASAQQNCSNPLVVTLCPATSLTAQTNLGMINDYTSSCNLSGEDLVYKMTTRPGTTQVYVRFSSLTSTIRTTLTTNCSFTGCSYTTVWSPGNNLTFSVLGNTTYYLWVDANTTITYNIAFGNDTTSTFLNIPNTQGNLNFESTLCATPAFIPTKPYLQVSFNSVFQTDPMTMSPLFVPATLCVVTYFKNTTGIEAIKKFDFYYNPQGFSSFTPSQMTFPGFYNAGTWTASWAGNRWAFSFSDLAGTGKGDFTGTPNTCLRYEFCFDVTPISNDPVKTNVKDSAFSDGFGMGFIGTVRSGCCPPGFANCLGTGPGGGGGTGGRAFGTSFADPAILLPIVLIQFTAKAKKETVEVNWTTASELNNDFFTIEKSMNGEDWFISHTTDGAGNSTSAISYSYIDKDPYQGTSYYRLKQTDFDGAASYSDPVAVRLKKSAPLTIYPNPAQGDVIVSGPESSDDAAQDQNLKFSLSNLMGETVALPFSKINGEFHLDLSTFANGIYLLEAVQDGEKSQQRIIIQN